jgi:hypothetical protein
MNDASSDNRKRRGRHLVGPAEPARRMSRNQRLTDVRGEVRQQGVSMLPGAIDAEAVRPVFRGGVPGESTA